MLARRSAVRHPRYRADLSALPPGGYGGTLPGGLLYGCPTAGRTCRTGASTLVTGIPAGTPAVDAILTALGLRTGLLMEPATTNVSPQGQDASLFTQAGSGAAYGGTAAGPDGVTPARAVSVASGGYSRFQNATISASVGGVTFSAWCMAVSGTARVQPAFSPSNAGISVAAGAAVGTTWQRVAASTGFAPAFPPGTTTLFPMISTDESGTPFGEAAQAHGPAYVGFMQAEGLGFPSSFVAPGATRAGTTLSLPSLAAVAHGGRVAIDVGFVPLGNAVGDAAFTQPYVGYSQRIWTAAGDPTTFVEIDAATSLLRASVLGSVTLSDAPVLYSPADVVQLYVEAGNGPTLVVLTTNSAGASVVGLSQAALPAVGALALAGGIALAHDPVAGLQLASAVQYVNFW